MKKELLPTNKFIWRKWFAWYPVRVYQDDFEDIYSPNNRMYLVWLERVERKLFVDREFKHYKHRLCKTA